jgi:hypothetical protein
VALTVDVVGAVVGLDEGDDVVDGEAVVGGEDVVDGAEIRALVEGPPSEPEPVQALIPTPIASTAPHRAGRRCPRARGIPHCA